MQRFCSVFHQILKLVPRTEFQQLADQHGSDRRSKGFSSWSQFVAMVFCQLGRAQSLREIEQGLASTEGRLQQLGVDRAAKRTTLAYANAHRPWQLYQDVFQSLYARCHAVAPGHKFRFKSPLLSLDASTIDLCAAMFDWAKFRRTKGAVKLHLLLDHDGHLPRYAVITDGKTSDIKVARQLELPPGSIVVIDRGYNDYLWFTELTLFDVGFVSRMKDGSLYEVRERRTPQGKGVLRDEIIAVKTNHPEVDEQPVRLRRIEFVDAEGKEYVFLTNRLDLAAATIAEIYRQRWQVELFFKAIKQNLRIKTFVGTSENALHIQCCPQTEGDEIRKIGAESLLARGERSWQVDPEQALGSSRTLLRRASALDFAEEECLGAMRSLALCGAFEEVELQWNRYSSKLKRLDFWDRLCEADLDLMYARWLAGMPPIDDEWDTEFPAPQPPFAKRSECLTKSDRCEALYHNLFDLAAKEDARLETGHYSRTLQERLERLRIIRVALEANL